MPRQPITQEAIDAIRYDKPFYRTVRQMIGGGYIDNGFSAYIKDPEFAPGGEYDIRSYLIIQEEFIKILEYIEPSASNSGAYSLQLRNLLMRICTEVESNLKSILEANGYQSERAQDQWTMTDYSKVNQSHLLSDYIVYLPIWDGDKKRKPFASWAKNEKLEWYQAYNNTKHARGKNLTFANLGNVVEAMSGLVALIAAQFYTVEPIDGPQYLEVSNGWSNKEHAIGGYFAVEFPEMPPDERYSLDLSYTKKIKHEYEQFNYR